MRFSSADHPNGGPGFQPAPVGHRARQRFAHRTATGTMPVAGGQDARPSYRTARRLEGSDGADDHTSSECVVNSSNLPGSNATLRTLDGTSCCGGAGITVAALYVSGFALRAVMTRQFPSTRTCCALSGVIAGKCIALRTSVFSTYSYRRSPRTNTRP